MFAAGLMLGDRPAFSIAISASRSTPWVLATEAPSLVSIGIPILLRLTVSAGIQLQSNTTSVAALDLSGLASGSEVALVNEGYLLGMGGAAGAGADFVGATSAVAGSAGGPAITGPGSGRLLRLTNGSGRIWGGGGGGGGGGYNLAYFGDPVFDYIIADGGSGGGGGAGGGAAGTSYSGAGSSNAGTTGASGLGGSAGATAQGSAGQGGAGGAFGAAGSSGANGIRYGGGPSDGAVISTAAAGGAAGAAIVLGGGSITYVSTGDIRGSVS